MRSTSDWTHGISSQSTKPNWWTICYTLRQAPSERSTMAHEWGRIQKLPHYFSVISTVGFQFLQKIIPLLSRRNTQPRFWMPTRIPANQIISLHTLEKSINPRRIVFPTRKFQSLPASRRHMIVKPLNIRICARINGVIDSSRVNTERHQHLSLHTCLKFFTPVKVIHSVGNQLLNIRVTMFSQKPRTICNISKRLEQTLHIVGKRANPSREIVQSHLSILVLSVF
nr:MAG TPA: hypothetical protein [Caudoviricetes sp.]